MIEDRRLRRVLARAALKSAERELAIAQAQLVTGDLEVKERLEAAQQARAKALREVAALNGSTAEIR